MRESEAYWENDKNISGFREGEIKWSFELRSEAKYVTENIKGKLIFLAIYISAL